ncbi:MAG: hypothetical protein WCS69_11315 [Ignavibacteriaceae bacterium]|jgi:hypothetical protein
MKPLVCLYCEGSDSKIVVVTKENNQIKILRAASVDVLGSTQTASEANAESVQMIAEESGIQIDSGGGANLNMQGFSSGGVFESLVNAEMRGIKLHTCEFIPVLTDPSIFYQVIPKRLTDIKVKTDVLKETIIQSDRPFDRSNVGITDLADGNSLASFLAQEVPCFKVINSLAKFNGKRVYKLTSVKSAELSLAYYVAKKKKFFPDDYSLIVYIGKEYSKLIFLQGRKLKHIGATLDLGTANLHTYDVYFSKILLEMENGGIPNLDNIVVCGEDDSENLVLSFYGTFPEANVSKLEFDNIDVSALSEDARIKISSFSVPFAAAVEYFDELSKETKGINLLPRYVLEEQKVFQFGWHGYLVLPLLFLTAFYFTLNILNKQNEINKLKSEIQFQTELKRQNLSTLMAIDNLTARINNFDQTEAILDSASTGTGIWNKLLFNLSDFVGRKKSFWVRNIILPDSAVVTIDGHAINRKVLTEFASRLQSASLQNITYDPIREQDAYRFMLTIKKEELLKARHE